MPVQSTHAQFDASLSDWLAIRDVLAGENAIKRAGDRYVPRLESQSDDEFDAYVARGFFYNATARMELITANPAPVPSTINSQPSAN